MNEAGGARPSGAQASAGRLLREAREKQGLHIAALAAAIKVTPKKLELLESDRFDELPDATFTRALAQTVCRALKTDPAPVMRLLPAPSGHRLEQVGEGLNTPFRERPGLAVQRDSAPWLASPWFWVTVVVLGAALVVYFLPAGMTGLVGRPASASAPSGLVAETIVAAPAAEARPAEAAPPPLAGLSADAGASSAMPVPGVGNVPAAADAAPASATAAPVTGAVQVRTSAASWVEVTDGRGLPLIARLMQPGEAVGLDGVAPFRVRIGNASATRLEFRGQPTELQAFTRDNVARLELR